MDGECLMPQYVFDDERGLDYNYEVGFLEGLRAALRVTFDSKISPLIEEQLRELADLDGE